MSKSVLPRILVIDDILGRRVANQPNAERANFCGQFLINDVTGDETPRQVIKNPIAEAVFYRGQRPIRSSVGDLVENDLEGTLRVIRDGWDRPQQLPWAMVLLDLSFKTGMVTEESHRRNAGVPEGRPEDDQPATYFGLRLLERIAREFKDLPVYILSGQPRGDVSRQFTNLGAKGFIEKGQGRPETLASIINRYGLILDESGTIIGQSRALLLALRAAREAAQTRDNLLVRGERGTGKELLVNYVHQQRRQSGKLITVNSPQLLPNLYVSTLFGIQKGVATNVVARKGCIEEADGGAVYFDEIYDMHSEVQAGILKVLQERKIMPEGANTPISVDVRFISATNANIEELAKQGKFRSDLLDRLRDGGTITLPPLRERMEDVPALVERYVRLAESEAERKFGRPVMPRTIEDDAMERLLRHSWPGNIRELASVIKNAVYENTDVEHLVPVHLRFDDPTSVPVATPNSPLTVVPSPLTTTNQFVAPALAELLQTIESFPVLELNSTELKEKLPLVERSFARFLARLLKASMAVTRSHEDDLVLTRAVKLLMGEKSPRNANKNLTASDAADIVKRVLGQLERTHRDGHPQLSNTDLLKDTDISEAIQVAQKRRPKNAKAAKHTLNGSPPAGHRRGKPAS